MHVHRRQRAMQASASAPSATHTGASADACAATASSSPPAMSGSLSAASRTARSRRASDGALFPASQRCSGTSRRSREAGFTVVRTYTPPPDDLVELAAEHGLRILAGVFYPDWRYLLGASRRRAAAGAARGARARYARRRGGCAGDEHVLALSLGNEIPADVAPLVRHRAESPRSIAEPRRRRRATRTPSMLVTYANYPTAEYLPLETLDFLTFNVFLEREADFRALPDPPAPPRRRPAARARRGRARRDGDAGREDRQAEALDWQLETAIERGVAGTCVFSWTDEWCGRRPARSRAGTSGSPDADRSPRPALDVARALEPARRSRDLDDRVAVDQRRDLRLQRGGHARRVPARTRARSTTRTSRSSSSTTARPTRPRRSRARHPRARLAARSRTAASSAARNEGYRAAAGDLDRLPRRRRVPDARSGPTSSRSRFDGPTSAAPAGRTSRRSTTRSARSRSRAAPGGPVHVLIDRRPRRARPRLQHGVLEDRPRRGRRVRPRLHARPATTSTSAGGCSTAAGTSASTRPRVVWHHRRPGLRAYLRQQRGYGRSEALVEARHPDRFTAAGTARWRGRIYDSLRPSVARAARLPRHRTARRAYQSVYRGGGHALDLAAPGRRPDRRGRARSPRRSACSSRRCFAVAAAALRRARARRRRRCRPGRTRRAACAAGAARFRAHVALLHLLQPLDARCGAASARAARRAATCRPRAAARARSSALRGGVLLLPLDRAREELVPRRARRAAPPRASRRRAAPAGRTTTRRSPARRSCAGGSSRARIPRGPCSCACGGCRRAPRRPHRGRAAALVRGRAGGRRASSWCSSPPTSPAGCGARGRTSAGLCARPAREPRALVLGAGGFLGSHTAAGCSSAGWDVTGVVRDPFEPLVQDGWRRSPARCGWSPATPAIRRCWRRLVPRADAIFPFAGPAARREHGPRARGPRRQRRRSGRAAGGAAPRRVARAGRLPRLAPAVRPRTESARRPRTTRSTRPARTG